MKKKIGLMAVAGLLLLGITAGGALAGITAKTEHRAVAQIATRVLRIGLDSGIKEQATSGTEDLLMNAMVPGDEKEAVSTVSNTGDYPVYVRVSLTRYFADKTDGQMKKIYAPADRGLDPSYIGIQGAEKGWLSVSDDGEKLVMYYARPLQPGESSSAFLQKLSLAPDAGNRYADLGIGLEIQVDAIQAGGADKAIPSEWGVYPVMDAQGTITGIEE